LQLVFDRAVSVENFLACAPSAGPDKRAILRAAFANQVNERAPSDTGISAKSRRLPINILSWKTRTSRQNRQRSSVVFCVFGRVEVIPHLPQSSAASLLKQKELASVEGNKAIAENAGISLLLSG